MTKEQYDFLYEKAKEIMQKTKDQNHDWPHIESVLENAEKILSLLPEKETKKLDRKILTTAIVYHDLSYVYYKASFVQYFFEGERTVKITTKIFQEAGLESEEIELLNDIIRHHIGSYFGFNVKNSGKSVYHKVVHDADQMDGNGFNNERVKKAEMAGKNSVYWFLVTRILKPIFGYYFFHTLKIYNMPEIVRQLQKEGYKGWKE